jgi:hypothetical protein
MCSLSYGVGEVEETAKLCSWVHDRAIHMLVMLLLVMGAWILNDSGPYKCKLFVINR